MEYDFDNLQKIINSKIIKVHENGKSRSIEFENGEIIQLQGELPELFFNDENLDIKETNHKCSLCKNESSENDFLFTIDGDTFICVKCTKLALETFLNNGVTIDLNIGDTFQENVQQINSIKNNIDKLNQDS